MRISCKGSLSVALYAFCYLESQFYEFQTALVFVYFLNTGAKEIQKINPGGPDNSQSIRPHTISSIDKYLSRIRHIYLNAKVSQLILKCYFLLFELKILLHVIMINKSNDLPSKQHENQTHETYDCRSSTRNVRQPKLEKSQSYNTLHFIESQCYTTLHFIRKRCLTVICFQNQKGRQIQAGYFMHLVTFITSTFSLQYLT